MPILPSIKSTRSLSLYKSREELKNIALELFLHFSVDNCYKLKCKKLDFNISYQDCCQLFNR